MGKAFVAWVAGIVASVIAGVLIWHFTNSGGGGKVQPPGNDGGGQSAQQGPEFRGPLQVNCSAEPVNIRPGGATRISVLATTSDNRPVPGAHVRLRAGGGTFGLSGDSLAVGDTDAAGHWLIEWHAPDPAATGYGIDVEASREGMQAGSSACQVNTPPA